MLSGTRLCDVDRTLTMSAGCSSCWLPTPGKWLQTKPAYVCIYEQGESVGRCFVDSELDRPAGKSTWFQFRKVTWKENGYSVSYDSPTRR
jgi:hypothetical protein